MTMTNLAYFLPYQKRWILDESPMKIYPKSRRIGVSYASSFRINDKCLRRNRFTQWVTSRDEFTAKEFITDYIALWAAASNAVCRGLLGDDVQVIDQDKGIRAFVATYANGNRVVSLSSTPEAFAGKGGDVFIDEADLHKDSGKVIDMALPCTTWGGQLEMVSALKTDGGPNTPFCRMVEDCRNNGNPMGWSFHRTDILQAVDEGFVEKVNQRTGANLSRDAWLNQMRGKCRTEEAWQTQYLIIPATDNEAMLSYEMIMQCETSQLRKVGNGPLYAGYDVARTKDLAAYYEFELVGDVLVQTAEQTFKNTPFRVQKEFLINKLRNNQLHRLALDASGMGLMLAEELADDFGPYRVDGVKFTPPVKEVLVMGLRNTFDDRKIRILATPENRNDLHKVKKMVTAAGNVRYDAERDDESGHADRFWAIALAKYACGKLNEAPTRFATANEEETDAFDFAERRPRW